MREYRTCGILGGIPPAEPRIENRKCSLDETRGKNKTDLPTSSKWQIGLFLWQKVARRETERSAASAKRAVRDGYSFQFNRACALSLEPDCVRFPKFCWNPGGFQRAQPLANLWFLSFRKKGTRGRRGGAPSPAVGCVRAASPIICRHKTVQKPDR